MFTEKPTPEKLTLVSHALCPFVQRAAIALAEKAVAFDRIDVDLGNKPAWFQEISPLGKTPVLLAGEGRSRTAIFESSVILEYLEETLPHHPLYPGDPLQRARERGWIEFASAVLGGISRLYNAPDAATLDAETRALTGMFRRVEAELQARPIGPWFGGGAFGIVDAAFAPVFRYFDTFQAEAGLSLLSGLPAIAAWRDDLARRPSVQAAVAADYPARLKRFLLDLDSQLSALISAHRPKDVAASA